MSCRPIRDRVREAGAHLLSNPNFIKKADQFFNSHAALKYMGDLEMFREYAAGVSVGYLEDKNHTVKIIIDTQVTPEFIDGINLEDIIDINKYRQYAKVIISNFRERPPLFQTFNGAGVEAFTVQGNEWLYKHYNILNEKGKLKQLSYKAASAWGSRLNKGHYTWKVVKLPSGYYSLVVTGVNENYKPETDLDISDHDLTREQIMFLINSTSDFLIRDGDYIFEADKQKQIVDTVSALIYKQLISSKDGKRISVSKAFISAKNNLKSVANLYGKFLDIINKSQNRDKALEEIKTTLLETNQEKVFKALSAFNSAAALELAYNDIQRILIPEVWNQVQEHVISNLQNLSIYINREGNLENREQEFEDISDETVVDENDFSSEKNYSNESFHQDPKKTTTTNVKLFLSRIPSGKTSYLGLATYIPFDQVFDELKRILSPITPEDIRTEDTPTLIDKYIKILTELGNKGKPYLLNIANVLSDPEVSVQLKNQFIATMRVHENEFNMVLWEQDKNGNVNIRVINSNRNSAHFRVLEQWAESLKSSSLAIEKDGRTILDTARIKKFKDRVINLNSKKNSTVAEYRELLSELFDLVGIVPSVTLTELLREDNYNKLIPNSKLNPKLSVNFEYSKSGYPKGVYSALINSLIKVGEQLEVNPDLTLDDINPYNSKGFTDSSIITLAKIFARYSEILSTSSYRGSDGKTRYVFAYHAPATQRVERFNAENGLLRKTLAKIPFSQRAFWLKFPNTKIELIDFEALKNARDREVVVMREDMEYREQDFTSASLFFASKHDSPTAMFFVPTMSDKKRTFIVKAPKIPVSIDESKVGFDEDSGNIIRKKGILTEEARTLIGDIVESELARMRALAEKKREVIANAETEQEKESALRKLKEEVGASFYEGANYFYLFPTLNRFIYDKNGVFLEGVINDPEKIVLIKEAAILEVELEISSTISNWVKQGFITYNKKTKNLETKIDVNYLKSLPAKTQAGKIVQAFADLTVNDYIAKASTMQVITGDPALAYNPKKFGSLPVEARVVATLDEYQKRGAKDVATGELGNTDWVINEKYRGFPFYNLIILDDDSHGTETEGFIKSIEEYKKKINRTDAQELTTVLEHINVLMNHGRISDEMYIRIRDKIEKAGPEGYYELDDEELAAINQPVILQPIKPVQVHFKEQSGLYERIYYVKTSSYPLIPQLTAGMEIDKLRRLMEKNNVDRAVFSSGVKLGAGNVVSVFNSDGTIKDNISLSKENIHTLDRKDFYIQQDVPYKEDKTEIRISSQMDRLVTTALVELAEEQFSLQVLNNPQFTSLSGKELEILKQKVKTNLMMSAKRALYTRMGIKLRRDETGREIPIVEDVEKLATALRSSAKKNGWSTNDLMHLKVENGRFVLSPGLGNAYEKIESLINAAITDTIKLHIRGASFVQGTSSGFKSPKAKTLDELTSQEKSGIVWIKGIDNSFDPQKGLTYITRDEESGKITYAQILVPWKYQADIKQFIDPETNTIDISKIDKELLNIIGFRIPNQGYSSQMVFQVVGFLPKSVGDLAVVPGEVTTQMGSDFDVDKLYSYIYNHVVNDQGRLVKVPAFIDKDGNFDRQEAIKWINKNFATRRRNILTLKEKLPLIQESYNVSTTLINQFISEEEDKIEAEELDIRSKEVLEALGFTIEDITIPGIRRIETMSLENAYIGIHEAILGHSKLIDKILEPLDADDLKITAKNVGRKISLDPYISRNRQLRDYSRQQAGKVGVSYFSRAVVGTATILKHKLQLVAGEEKNPVYVTLFANDNGKVVPLNMISGNAVSYFDGDRSKPRTQLKNLVIMQSGSVDNAKDPVMDDNNLNINTFPVAVAITLLSSESGKALDLRYVSYFLTQPAVKKIVNLIQSFSGSLSEDFIAKSMIVSTSVGEVLNTLSQLYKEATGEELKEELYDKVKLSPKDMLEMIHEFDQKNPEHIIKQCAIAVHFDKLYTIGQDILKVFRALSYESKGLPKNYWEIASFLEQVNSIGSVTFQIDGVLDVLMQPQAKYVLDTTREAKTIIEQIMPVGSKVVTQTIEAISELYGRELTAEQKREIWLGIRSYIFSNPELFGVDEASNIDLLVGPNSLVKRIKRFLNTEAGKNFKLLSLLELKEAAKKENPDIIIYRSSASERVDEAMITTYFIDMLVSNNPEARMIAKDLIRYAYVTGGNQAALQFVKYIPVAYLELIGFGDTVLSAFNSLEAEDSLIKQILQHTPKFAFRVSLEKDSSKYNEKTGELRIKSENVVIGYGENTHPASYVSFYDSNSYTWRLFELDSYNGDTTTYKEISLLGGKGKDYVAIDEYQYGNQHAVSVFESNVPYSVKKLISKSTNKEVSKPVSSGRNATENNVNKVVSSIVNKVSKEVNDAFESLTAKIQALTSLTGNELVESLSKSVYSEHFKTVLEVIANNKELLEGLKIKLINDTKSETVGSYDSSNHVLTINFWRIRHLSNENSALAVKITERTITHELIHAVTSRLVNAYMENRNSVPKAIAEKLDRLEELRAYVESTLSEQEKIILQTAREKGVKAVSASELKPIYGLINLKEFLAETLVYDKFQQRLNNTPYNGHSILMEIFQQIIGIFKELASKLGFDVKKNSALEAGLIEALELMQDINKFLTITPETKQDEIQQNQQSEKKEQKQEKQEPVNGLDENKPVTNTNNIFEFDNGVRVNTGHIILNKQQAKAVNLAAAAIDNGQRKFVIRGYAGTGKSTVVGTILNYIKEKYKHQPRNIYGIANTHAAVLNLAALCHKQNVRTVTFKTIASFLTKIKVDGEFVPIALSRVQYNSIIIVDEASMISTSDYNDLIDIANKKNLTLIFIGDKIQLPSPGNTKINSNGDEYTEASPALEFQGDNQGIELTEVMRQSNESPLVEELHAVRENIGEEELPIGESTKINEKGEGILIFNNYREMLEKVVEAFRENPHGVKYIAYTNKEVQAINEFVASRLGTLGFKKGAILTGYMTPAEAVIKNSSNYEVIEDPEYVDEESVRLFTGVLPDGTYYDKTVKVSGYNVTVRLILPKSISEVLPVELKNTLSTPMSIFIVDTKNQKNMEFFKEFAHLKEIASDKKVSWTRRRDLSESLDNFYNEFQIPDNLIKYKGNIYTIALLQQAHPELFVYDKEKRSRPVDELMKQGYIEKSIDYGYAITAHKSQGATFDVVFSSKKDLENPRANRKVMLGKEVVGLEKNMVAYVTFSRPSKVLALFNPDAKSTENTFREDQNKTTINGIGAKVQINKQQPTTKQEKQPSPEVNKASDLNRVDVFNAALEALGIETIDLGDITYTDEEGNICAEKGLRGKEFTKGSKWTIVKDLTGYPSHKEGGVDLKFDTGGVKILRDGGEIIAKNGLILPNVKRCKK